MEIDQYFRFRSFILLIVVYTIVLAIVLIYGTQLVVDIAYIDKYDFSDTFYDIILILAQLFLIIFILRWTYRAYKNIKRLKLFSLELTPDNAVLFWLIPVLNFFKPYMIVKEIWDGTQASIQALNPSYIYKPPGVLLIYWWVSQVIFYIWYLFIYFYKLSYVQRSYPENLHMELFKIFMPDIFAYIPLILLAVIIYKINKMEKRLAQEVKKAGGQVLTI